MTIVTDTTSAVNQQNKNYVNLTEALLYGSIGFAVLPCRPESKMPLVKWQDAATSDLDQIQAWWGKWPTANVALYCAKSGIIGLDFDPAQMTDETWDFFNRLANEYPTLQQKTPTGGHHLLYRLPPGVSLSQSNKALPGGVDVRTEGYLLLAPSEVVYRGKDAEKKGVPDGHRGRYEWVEGRSPDNYTLEPLPDFVLELLQQAQAAPQPQAPQARPPQAVGLSDQEYLNAMFAIKHNGNGAKYQRLWNGDWSGYPSQSEGDIALCDGLAWATNRDKTAMDRLFRQSGLMRDQWDKVHYSDGRTYGQGAIDEAADTAQQGYDPNYRSAADREAIEKAQALAEEQAEERKQAAVNSSSGPQYGVGDKVIWRCPAGDIPATIREIAYPPMKGIWHYYIDCLAMPGNSGIPENELFVADDDDEPEANPLNVGPKKALNLGWIDRYADLMTRLTGSPREFNQLTGLALIATVIQRRAVLRMSFADIYPNVYGVIIARSSVYHKSSALAKPRSLLQRALLEKLLLSELQTSEGLLRQLSGQSSGLIVRDEIGTLFASHNTRYLQQVKPDLTALYDCYPYSRSLSAGDIKVDKPYLNILGATTPARFYEGVSMVDWQDGFLARWLFVLPEGEPNFDAMTGLFNAQDLQQLDQLVAKLFEIDRQSETDFQFTGDAFALWDTWQRNAAKEAYYYGDDVAAAIVTRYAAYALKFAMILSAVNGPWGIITPETMQTAIDLSDDYKRYAHKLLAEKSNYGVSGAKLQKVFAYIKAHNGCGTREITRSTNYKRDVLTPVIDKLLEVGAITSSESLNTRNKTIVSYTAMTQELPVKTWR